MSTERTPHILAVDDDVIWLDQIPIILEDICKTTTIADIDTAISTIEETFFDVVILDLNFENDSRTGLEVFRKIHSIDNGASVIVVSGETHPQRLIDVFNAGVSRFIPKPATPDAIRIAVREVLREREISKLATQSARSCSLVEGDPLLGNSPGMVKLQREFSTIVEHGIRDVLIQGETGTGKELLARLLATTSDPSGRFIPVHCGALSEGVVESELFGHVKGAFTGADRERVGAFEAASGGYIFLDEIGEMPLSQQAKILRVLQERTVQKVGSNSERKVNFRTISATNVDLETAICEKTFREDLYFRISKAVLRIPPLRERKEDIPLLIQQMIASSKRKKLTFSPEGMLLLKHFPWPGNVRQLRSIIEQLVIRTKNEVIRESDVIGILPSVKTLSPVLNARVLMGNHSAKVLNLEVDRFKQAINQASGASAVAAQILGLSRATFYRKAKELGVIRGYNK